MLYRIGTVVVSILRTATALPGTAPPTTRATHCHSAGPRGASLRRKDAPRTQERNPACRQQAFRAIGRIPEGGIPCRVGRGEKPPFKVIDTAPFFRLDTVTLADPSGKPKVSLVSVRSQELHVDLSLLAAEWCGNVKSF